MIETLGRAHECGWKITIRCVHSREDHAGESARECYHRYELDIETTSMGDRSSRSPSSLAS
jgi:hypothetical protein